MVLAITVEVATARRIQDMPEGKAQEQRRLKIAAHSQALREIFLGEPWASRTSFRAAASSNAG